MGYEREALREYERLVDITKAPYSATALLSAVRVAIKLATPQEWLEFEDMREKELVKTFASLAAETYNKL